MQREEGAKVTPYPRLHESTSKSQLSKIKKYLAEGDDINQEDEFEGLTALALAVLRGSSLETVKLLLQKGADTERADKEGFRPLFTAASNNRVAIAKALIRAGADVDAGNGPVANTALMSAASNNHPDMIKLLIDSGCDVSARALDGSTALGIAADDESYDIVLMLLDLGADVNERVKQGFPLIRAAGWGQCYLVEKYLERGAAIDAQDSDGYTGLHQSIIQNHVDVAKVLIKAGADVTIPDNDFVTPLHNACLKGHDECVRLLIMSGADACAVHNGCCTPLHHAAQEGYTSTIELLLSAGAHKCLRLVNGRQKVPLTVASNEGHANVVKLLLESGSDPNPVTGKGALFGVENVECLKILLRGGASPTALDSTHHTPLHHAGARGSSAPVICALFKAGVDPTLRSMDGQTAADLARENGHGDTAKLLDMLAAKYRETKGGGTTDIHTTRTAPRKAGVPSDKGEMSFGRNLAASFATKKCGQNVPMPNKKHVDGNRSAPKSTCSSSAKCKGEEHCLNCDIVTARRCSACGITSFCSHTCELRARHVCCG